MRNDPVIYLFADGKPGEICESAARVTILSHGKTCMVDFNSTSFEVIDPDGQVCTIDVYDWLWEQLWWKGSEDPVGRPLDLNNDPVLNRLREWWKACGLPDGLLNHRQSILDNNEAPYDSGRCQIWVHLAPFTLEQVCVEGSRWEEFVDANLEETES